MCVRFSFIGVSMVMVLVVLVGEVIVCEEVLGIIRFSVVMIVIIIGVVWLLVSLLM